MPNKDQAPTGAAYTALHSLLGAVAYTVKAQQVCLVSPGGEPNCVRLVASEEPQPAQGEAYKAGMRDVSVPVHYDDRELAQLVVVNAEEGLDRTSLMGFARAAGYLLGHSTDINDAQYAVEESRVLHDLGLQFGAPTELSELLDSVVKGVRRVLGADYANLTTVEEDGSRHWLAMDGYRTDAYKQFAYRKGQGTAGRIMRERGPVLLEGIGVSPDLPAEEFPIHTAEGRVGAGGAPHGKGHTYRGAYPGQPQASCLEAHRGAVGIGGGEWGGHGYRASPIIQIRALSTGLFGEGDRKLPRCAPGNRPTPRLARGGCK